MRIQNYLIDKKIQAALTKSIKTAKEHAFVSITNIAIFVDELSAFNEKEFRDLQEIIKLDETHFNILTFKEKKSSYNEFRGTVLFQNEINWQGKIISKDANEFINQRYDLLIDYTQADSLQKQLIVALINAHFKVGYSDKKDSLYNFMISINPTEIKLFNKEMVRYLKILKLKT